MVRPASAVLAAGPDSGPMLHAVVRHPKAPPHPAEPYWTNQPAPAFLRSFPGSVPGTAATCANQMRHSQKRIYGETGQVPETSYQTDVYGQACLSHPVMPTEPHRNPVLPALPQAATTWFFHNRKAQEGTKSSHASMSSKPWSLQTIHTICSGLPAPAVPYQNPP